MNMMTLKVNLQRKIDYCVLTRNVKKLRGEGSPKVICG